jgi:hypothetical protein
VNDGLRTANARSGGALADLASPDGDGGHEFRY